ncbi:MAG: BCCT family transporter [Acidobacteria bacterium]|nr:BCCT family transporter [Acidobacteriota bacterium]MYF14139.1 BCCT family transporter [Acidobacteriota bacterium]MYI96833.1 BCCT family transporter [Acidobacteriota bacterium]
MQMRGSPDSAGDGQITTHPPAPIGRDNIRPFGLDIHNPVFVVSSLTVIAFVAGALLFRDTAAGLFDALYAWLTSTFDWMFMAAANVFMLFCLAVVASPLGRIRLGGPDARPDYSNWSWFAMLFAAGIGIGLMFFGVAEPVTHFRNPPLGVAPADTAAVEGLAVAATLYHWGLHGWAIYAVAALALAFAAYNLGLPMSLRSAFYPVLGDRVWGRFGHVVDILAVFATIFGLATSLGLGVEQLAAGLDHLFGIPPTHATEVLLIAAITAVTLASVVLGMQKGVKRLSQANMALALALLAFVFAAGPTLDLLARFAGSLGHYLGAIGPLSNWVGREDLHYLHGWTTFYWAWWLSWAPCVGMFVARISRGRTVRSLVGCMLLFPLLLETLWFNTFGGTALSFQRAGATGMADAVQAGQPELALFRMLELLPLADVTSFVSIVLVMVFFVTSSDSGTLVIDTITAGGKMDAPIVQRVFWASFEGLIAITLLISGGLVALQTAALTTGFPITLILLALCYSIWKGLRAARAG